MTKDPPEGPFSMVALGASAGGLEALTRFLGSLPPDGGVAYVVVMHLDASRPSALTELLRPHTRMEIADIEDGTRARPDRVYVAPVGKAVTVSDGVFRLEARDGVGAHTIDHFMSSLAEDLGEKAVGVVLSGTGTDGTQGVRAIKERGGLTMAEDPATAAYGAMPRSAVATGVVDLVFEATRLGPELVHFLSFRDGMGEDPDASSHVVRILELLRRRRGYDFGGYKESTVHRRIRRRQVLVRCASLKDFADLLDRDDTQLDALFRDFLITVTRFFRDPDAFDRLAEVALPRILGRKETGDTFRIWVPGCATGEEAYSLGMLAVEGMEARGLDLNLQIFATDLDPHSVAVARRGLYPENIEADVSGMRLERFFVREDHSYRVSKELRERVILSTHNVTSDPPFSRVDLISCRNLLIYLNPDLQGEVFQTFHFALRPEGYLFLGSSESTGQARALFEPVAKAERIFRARSTRAPLPTRARPQSDVMTPFQPARNWRPPRAGRRDRPFPIAAERVLLEAYAPPAVLVDRSGEVVYFLGRTERYLAPPTGAPDLDVIRMARISLRASLRRTIQVAREEKGRAAESSPVRIRSDEGGELVRVIVRPLDGPEGEDDLLLVAFESVPEDADVREGGEVEAGAPDSGVEELSEELERTRRRLEVTLQELETVNEDFTSSNEELMSSNEELLSLNEELQSSSEELEASKEEVGSANEELQVLNAELRDKLKELAAVNADIQNLMASTEIATLFLGTDLVIHQFTPSTSAIFRLISTDRGRPLSDISSRLALDFDDLSGLIQKSLDDVGRVEAEVRGLDGEMFMMRINPYRTLEGKVAGVVLTFTDITRLRKLEADVLTMAESIQDFSTPFIVIDERLEITNWNRGAELVYGFTSEEMLGRSYLDLVPERHRAAEQELFRRIRAGEEPRPTATERVTKDGRIFPVRHEVSRVTRNGLTFLTIADRDATEQVQAERKQELLLRELDHRVKNMLVVVLGILEQTLSKSQGSIEAFASAFRERVATLAVAHRVMAASSWDGASLRELIELTMHPLEVGDRVQLDGDAVVLPDFVVSPIAMVLHELVTNAIRHGALSVPGGRITVEWRVRDDGLLGLRWIESGGPPVREPARRGFGTRLIAESIPYEIGGRARLEFRPEGLFCELIVPLERREG